MPCKDNNLRDKHPDVAKEWHRTKNGKRKPSEFISGSKKKVWWKCPKVDDHEWEATITNRTHGSGCPFCARRKSRKDNCLADLNPDLAKQWHPTKNGNLKPTHVTCGSSKKVWWKCPEDKDHEWEAKISVRNRGAGCQYCSGRKSLKEAPPKRKIIDYVLKLKGKWGSLFGKRGKGHEK
jgi:hypothetical protein